MKHIHIIGICGVGTSALAIALHQAGFKVTGSDKGFFPPVSTELTSAGVHFHAGWHPELFKTLGTPDIVVAGGGGTASSNGELQWAHEQGLRVITFAEAVGEFICKKESIVCVGTWGKSTSTALLTHIFSEAGARPSYFIGAIPVDRKAGGLTDTQISIVEGDEYQAAIFEKRAKFFFYKPTTLLMTALSWDHADLYPTPEDFLQAFRSLLATLPSSGSVVACGDDSALMGLLKETGMAYTRYGKDASADYHYHSVTQTTSGITFTIVHNGVSYPVTSSLYGTYNAENITGCFALAHQKGIEPTTILRAIASFRGMKRRLEKRLSGKVTVIDDIAHSPRKAQAVLDTLRGICSGSLTVVFEPNIGGRERVALSGYDGAFTSADTVIIPRLSVLKGDALSTTVDGQELATTIAKTHPHTLYIEDDAALVRTLIESQKPGDYLAFCGSHGFRGMIDEVITKLSEKF
jgi:UDP-N-acetylmuramate: L-alanyl-gamma-D-glutamyl-meso-diaminopimelate ligase